MLNFHAPKIFLVGKRPIFNKILLVVQVLGITACSSISAQQSQKPQENIITSENFEKGRGGVGIQTQGQRCSSVDQMLKLVSTPARSGQQALKTQVTNCDERAEIVARTRFAKDKTYWLGWSMYVPENYFKLGDPKNTFTIVQQLVHFAPAWEHKDSFKLECGNPPHSAMIIDHKETGDQMSYRVTYPKDFRNGVTTLGCRNYPIPLVKNQWQDFVMQVRLSESDRGFLKLWMNDTLYINYQGALLTQDKRFGPGDVKFGVYVGDPGRGERTIYFDELKVGSSASSYQGVRPEKIQVGRTSNR